MTQDSITRRDVLLGGAAVLAARTVDARSAHRRPNIVFILADDLGAGDLSCYGRPDYRTPHIDSLARDGVKLTQAYANSCTCSPTRVALLSGRYQNRLAVGNYDPLPPQATVGFPADHPTLPSTLKRAGYATGLIGKWHLGTAEQHSPRACGYGEFFGLRGSHVDYYTHANAKFAPGSSEPDLYENETPIKQDGYATDMFSDRAVSFIERHREQPFLLSLHYTAPHWPWQGPDGPGGARLTDFHYEGGSLQTYAAMMGSLDAGVGRVLAALDRLQLRDDTIVVFTSDNGGERFSYQWPLRGAKFDLLEGGIRVPALVRWPKRLLGGAVSEQLVMTMDWLPTFAGAAGAAVSATHPSDGVDVLPMLAGERPLLERSVFWRTQWSHAARQGRWKYLVERNHEYLYDVSADPMERANRRLAEPQIAASLKQSYQAWAASMAPIPADAHVPRELYERLEALERPPGAPPPPFDRPVK